MNSLTPQKSFNRAAKTYNEYAFVQKEVVKELVKLIPSNFFGSVLDLGCGSGAIFDAMPQKPKRFVGVDFSSELLKLHPKDDSVELLNLDFESDKFFDAIESLGKFDLLLSSCSLQWCRNPKRVFERLIKKDTLFCFAIVKDTTFNELHRELEIESPVQKTENILESLSCEFVVGQKSYELFFDSQREALEYIKYSGVSGSVGIASAPRVRSYLKKDSKVKLNFDVLFLSSVPR